MIKTRFAPSPTGYLHFGSLKAMLFPFLYAKKHDGEFILRIDDTDRERSKIEYEESILKDIQWFGVNYAYKIKQSERIDKYDYYFEQLKSKGLIYCCYETPEQLEKFRLVKRAKKEAPIFTKQDANHDLSGDGYWRFEIKKDKFFMQDIIMGKVNFHREWSDPVIRKNNGDYSYMFTSVVDDIEENITHIIRGNEHLVGAFIQKEIGNAILGKDWLVEFAHFPLFLDSEGSKLSKRDLSTNLSELKQFEPMTLVSVLSNLGTGTKPIISKNWQDYIAHFDLRLYSKNMQKFDFDNLYRINRKILHLLSRDEIEARNEDFKTWQLISNNCSTWQEFLIKSDKLKKFNIEQSKYKDLFLGVSMEELSMKLQLSSKEIMLNLYEEIFQEKSGPKISDLIKYKNDI